MFIDVEITYFILEHLLTAKINRSCPEIIFATFVRFLTLLWCTYEFARTTSFGLIFAIVFIERMNRLYKWLFRPNAFCKPEIITQYNSVKIIYANMQSEIERTVYCLLTPMFWSVVILTWMLIRCSAADITHIFYIVVFIEWFVSNLLLWMLLPSCCCLLDKAEPAISMYKFYSNWNLVRKPSFQTRLAHKRALSFRPIVIKYAIYWRLGKEAAIDYLWRMILQSIDAIIMF